MRPMLMEFPNEPLVHYYNDQFMFGASILVKPDEDLQVDEPEYTLSSFYLIEPSFICLQELGMISLQKDSLIYQSLVFTSTRRNTATTFMR